MSAAYRFMTALMGLSVFASLGGALLFCVFGELDNAQTALVVCIFCALLGKRFSSKALQYTRPANRYN